MTAPDGARLPGAVVIRLPRSQQGLMQRCLTEMVHPYGLFPLGPDGRVWDRDEHVAAAEGLL